MPRYKPLKGFSGLKKPAVLTNVDKTSKRVKAVLDRLKQENKSQKK